MTKLATRENATLRSAAIEHRSRALDASRVAPTRRPPSVLFVLVAAVLAVTAVGVADGIEERVLDAPIADVPVAAPSNAVASDAPDAPDLPLTSAVLPSGTMALTLREGAAVITTGPDEPAIELATTRIGNLELGNLELGDVDDGALIVQGDGEVSYDRGDVTEWYRSVPEGIEHGYTIDAPLSDSEDLTVQVAVADATPTLVAADTVAIQRPDATSVWYQGLIAFDADGLDLPATMAVVDGAIELRVDTTGARYPITIDPVISDANPVRPTAASPRLTPVADTARLAGAFAGPDAFPSSCSPGSVMTGLTVFSRTDQNNQLRVMVPRCRPLGETAGVVQFSGPAVDAADFGTRSAVLGPQTRECVDGSAVTGLVADVGSLIDRMAIRCNPLLGSGAVGSPTIQSDFYGGGSVATLLRDPVDCVAGFGSGLQGTAGDDITAVGLQCATVAIGTDVDGSRLGFAVDVDGDRMVASAPFAEVGGVAGAGTVFVYERTADVWVQTAEIVSPSPVIDGGFGDSLALSGDGLAIGESNRYGLGDRVGRAWVFEFDGTVWSLLQEFVAPISERGPGDYFGADVAWIDADDLYVGAPGAEGAGAVYRANTTSGTTTNAIPAGIVPTIGDDFGFSVDVTPRPDAPGYWAAIGVPGAGGGGGGYFLVTLDANGDSVGWRGGSGFPAGTRAGTAVAIDGNRAVIGQYGTGTMTFSLFEYREFLPGNGVEWASEVARNAGSSAGFEVGVRANDYLDIDGEFVAIGQPDGGGRIALFRFENGVLADSPTFVEPAGRGTGDRIGRSSALDGALLVAGAPGDDGAIDELTDSGAVYTSRLPLTATFINTDDFAAWEVPTNWDVGVVPGPSDAVVIPFGTYPELGEVVASTVDTLSVVGQLRLRGDLRVGTSSTIAAGATVDLQSTSTFDPSGDLTLDGELSSGGTVDVDGPASVTGSGRFINDGALLKSGTGTLTLGPGVAWTSRFSSNVDVTGGDVDILGELFDDNTAAALTDDVTSGTFRVAAGTSIGFSDDLIVGPGTRFVTQITGPPSTTADYGRIVVGNALGFDQTVPNPGPGKVGFEAVVDGYDVEESDVYAVITCGLDCAADLGDAKGIEFDDFRLSGLTAVQTRTSIELRDVANKIVAPDPDIGVGTDVSVDGDWAVVGSRAGGPLRVYEFVAGGWELRQSLSNGTAERVVIDGDTILADGIRYTRPSPGSPFVPVQVSGGTSFDIDGRLVVRGERNAGPLDGTAVVSLLAGVADESLVPAAGHPSFGADVAVVDLGGGAAIAAVSAPAFPGGGRVYLFDLAVDEGLGTVSASPRGFVTGGNDFGRSIALSDGNLVVGDPFDGTPTGGAGAAWVYERTGPGATFTGDPAKLQASNADVSDTLGDDVAIDGDVIVVGAPIAQKFAFPLRDGAAYVFQYDGTDWVETDILRADDGFNGELFGDGVAVSGNRVLVGAPNDVNDNGPAAGAFYFYETTTPPAQANTYSGPALSIAPGNWANPLAWSLGVVPGPTDAAVIPAGKFVRVTSPGPVSVGSVTVAGNLSVLETPSSPGVRFEILQDSFITPTGRLFVGGSIDCTVDGIVTPVPAPFFEDECVPSVTTMQLSANLQVDGAFSAATQVQANGIWQIQSNPVLELDTGAAFSGIGSVSLSAQVAKNDPGTVTFGPDLDVNLAYGSVNDTRGVLEVTGGTLDIQSAAPTGSFTADGTIEVGPGATVSIADDLTLSASSVIEIGINGPSAFPANSGRIVLPASDLIAAGTLRATVTGGYVPTTADVYPLVSCTTGDCAGGTFAAVDGGVLTVARTAGAVTAQGTAAPVPVSLDFGLGLATGAPSTVSVAPSGIAVNTLDRGAIARANGVTPNVAASSISSIGPQDTSLASIALGATPLRAVILESDVLSAIPLVDIDLEGGWERIIALSPNLRKEPLTSLTFGQVLADGDPLDANTPAGALAATPLRAVDVAGTPLRAVSLAAIALGSTPLRAVPLRAVAAGEPNAWCQYLGAELLAEYANCDAALDDLSLIEATLRGASIDAAPLRAVPLRAVDIAESPLRAVLVEDISLGASPIGSIPLRAVPLRAVELQASPLRAVPLRAVPLRAVPVSAIDLDQAGPQSTPLRAVELNASPLRAVTTSIALDAAPLRAVDVNGTPVSAIQVQGAPLRAVPIAAVMLADLPLRAVALEEGGEVFEWCDVLASIGAGFDCDSGVDLDTTTINDLSIRGVPLRAVPLRAVPLRAVLANTSIGSIPLRAVPLRAVPLRAVPLGGITLEGTTLGSVDVNGTPLRAVPLRAVDLAGTPLGAIPLRAVQPGAIPLRAVPLRAVPLRAVPLRAVPLRAVDLGTTTLADTPLRAVDVLGSPLRAVPLRAVSPALLQCGRVDCARGTLGDALLAGAISADVTLEQIQGATEGIALADLVAALLGVSEADVLDAIAGLTLDDLTAFDDLTLGDLPRGIVELDAVTLGALLDGLSVGTFADLVDAIIDPLTGKPVSGLEADILAAIAAQDLELGDLERFGDVTLDDIFAGTHPITLADIEPVLRFVTVDALQRALNTTVDLGNLTLGDLSPDELGQLTLADLSQLVGFDGQIDIADLLSALGVGDLLDGFTLGDLLLAFLDPSSLAYGGVEFVEVDASSLPIDTVGSARFAADFTLTASSARTIELQIQTPRTARYVPGSGRILGAATPAPLEPTRFGDLLTWSFVAEPGLSYTISFDVLPTLTLGSTSLGGVARVVGTDISLPATASVTVVEGNEPNDFTTADETTSAAEDVVYLTYIAEADDIDVFEIDVAEDDELVVQLSNLDADLDLVLWGSRGDVGTGGSLSRTSEEAPLFAVTDPDGDTSDAEPLEDFRRLDEVDPSLGVIGVSNADGTKSETLTTGRLDAGTYYIQVSGANGAINVQPAALQLKVLEADQRPVCAPIAIPTFTGVAPLAPSASALSGADTLLLINERRLEQLHGVAGRTAVRAAADRLVAAAGAPGASLGISPVVVPVDAYPSVRAAYAAWDSAGGSCDPDAANAVVAAINDVIIDPVRDQLTHVVILGPDELIPMARLADKTQIANEYDLRNEFDGDLTGVTPNGRNAFTSVFWESSILSDEPYGDAAARSLGDRYLYVTDVALGRVVETPTEIADALDTYVDFNGTLDIDTATVLGYDFLADGSEAIADILDDTIPDVDRELALGPDPATGEGWTADAATEKLRQAATNSLISLNAHFDHYRSLPAIGDKVAGFDENLIAEEVRRELGADSLAQSLIFSMGCHSGLSVSDITIGRTNQDWAQNLGRMGSLFVGNTGFGYGDTETVAYTEQLMALFAAQVTAPFENGNGSTTVGQALAWAKNEFVAGLQTFSVYDEKAVQESTFYGLPFYRVGLATAPLPAAPTNVATPDATGTASLRTTIDAINSETTTERGVYFANLDAAGNEQLIVAPGRPIQPKAVADVSVVDPTDPTALGTVARGAIVLDMQSTYRALPNPVIATPVFDEAFSQPEPTLNSGVFPTKPLEITTTTGPAGRRQQLVVATGQYRADDSVQRLDDGLDVVVYYGDESDPDYTPPTIGAVESSITGGVLTVSLTAGSGADVDRVYLLVAQNPGIAAGTVAWTGLDLARTPNTDRWTGSLSLAPGTTDVEFIVQAKDLSGNVGYATNKARNFGSVVVPPPPAPPAPPAAQLTVVAPPTPTSGWFEGSATISVPVIAATGSPARYSINGVVQPRLLEAGDNFEITSDGVQNWSVVSVTGQQVSGTVRIDADGAPRVILGTPLAGGTGSYVTGTGRVDAICRDTSLVRCDLAVGATPVVNGQALPALPGSYTLTYSAVDQLGRITEGSAAFSIVSVTAAPVIANLTVPTVTVPITTPVDLSATFNDASAPFDTHTATVDWGDGTSSTATVVSPATPDSSGTIVGSRRYATTGRFTVTVTLADSTNRSVTRTAEVVVNDPAAAPEIRSLVAPTVPRPISEPIQIDATFIDRSVPDDSFTASINWGDGTTTTGVVTPATLDSSGTVTGSQTYAAPGTYEVIVTVTDRSGRTDDERAVITVVAPTGAPQIVSVTGPTVPQTMTTPVTIGATFLDVSGPFDTYTATVDWGDGTTTAATVTAPTATSPGRITASRRYVETGVYTVGVTVRDQTGASSSQPFEFVVVFDPTEKGTVSGSGTYWSGPAARPGGSRWGAPALFGFDAKYKQGVVVGETELRLLGDFYFKSTKYDYLIVNDALAVAEGTGKIGSTTLRFRVQAIDNGWLDFFQLTIWNPTTNQIVYDNGVLFDKGDLVLLGGIKVKDR